MPQPAAPRAALAPAAFTFEHWSLDATNEPGLVAAEAACRATVEDLVAQMAVPAAGHTVEECGDDVLADRIDEPDGWSDVGVTPGLSDVVLLHRDELRHASPLAEQRDAVGAEMSAALRRRGWCPPGTAWDSSGHLWYRAGDVLGWHTNTRVPGWRAYLTWTAEPGRSFFRYRDPADGRIVTSEDTGVDLRLFHVSATEPFWHCVWAGADRHSFGYRLVDSAAG